MRKTAFTTLLSRPDSVLSPHFGKAKWILIRDDHGAISLERNAALNGHAVVDVITKNGCTDAVFTHIGPGALIQLENAGIHGWIGPANVPVPELAERLSRNELERARLSAANALKPIRECGDEKRGRSARAAGGKCCCPGGDHRALHS